MKTLSVFIIYVLCIGFCCEKTGGLSPGMSLEDLLNAPLLVTAGNREYRLETYLWRDFMPVSPPDGKPLIAIVRIVATDSMAVPETLESDRIYIIYGDEMWESELSASGDPGGGEDFKLERIARDGPKWGPDVAVEVVVRIFINEHLYYLRASQQWIHRTD